METMAGSWLETIAKVGLGVASFGALLFLIRWLTVELTKGRVAFLASLEKQHVDHTSEVQRILDHHERQTDRVLDRIDGLACAKPENGRDRTSRGGSSGR